MTPTPDTPTEQSHREVPCRGFHWIGQPWSSCDNCGRPWNDHDGYWTPGDNVEPFSMRSGDEAAT